MAIILDEDYMKKIQEETNSVKVKNIKHTSLEKYKYPPDGDPSWLYYYKKSKDLDPDIKLHCSNIECNDEATDGCHVKKVKSADANWYITPLCKKCNKLEDSFKVHKKNLVPVNKNNK